MILSILEEILIFQKEREIRRYIRRKEEKTGRDDRKKKLMLEKGIINKNLNKKDGNIDDDKNKSIKYLLRY
jgi:hypothetical protein